MKFFDKILRLMKNLKFYTSILICLLRYSLWMIFVFFIIIITNIDSKTFKVNSNQKDPRVSQLNQELIAKLEDHSIVIDKTLNGTTYYIKSHGNSEGKIMVGLIINAGSVLERDDQLGLAHFVEHMGFNGTKKFPRNEVIEILQKEGIRFGPDFNASTGYDATQFFISIPDDKPHLLPLALDIVEEWLHEMTYEVEEIEKEKGVVLEEVRAAEQPYPKAIHKMWDYLHEGTPFYNRDPGGKLDVVASAPRGVIKSFYDTWYKPELAAVVVVGDVELEEVEREILSRFRFKTTSPEHPNYGFPLESTTSFNTRMIPIKDTNAAPFGILAFREKLPENKKNFFWKDGVDRLTQKAFNYRMEQVVRESSYLKSAEMIKILRGRTGALRAIYFEPRPGFFLEGYQELVAEIERLRRWGINDKEFRQIIVQNINFSRSSPRVNNQWFSMIYNHFIYQEIITDEKSFLKLLEDILQGEYMVVEDVNIYLKTLGLSSGIRFAALYPSNETLPKENIFRNHYHQASSLVLEKPQSLTSIQTLMSPKKVSQISKGMVEIEKKDEGYLFKLGNGVKVFYQPLVTSEKRISIMAMGYREKGEYLDLLNNPKDKETMFNFLQSQEAFPWAKLGGYDYRQLQNFFENKSLSFDLDLQITTKHINLNIPTDYLETGFQLLYLGFTDLAYDPEAAEHFKRKVTDDIDFMRENDHAYLQDRYQKIVFPDNPFRFEWDDYRIEYFDPELAYRIMKDSLNDVGDFTFYITGNVEVAELFRLIEKYLASLPAVSSAQDPDIPLGITSQQENKVVYQRGQGQSLVGYGWINPVKERPTLKNQVISSLIGEVLSMELLKEIREKEAGVYSIHSYMSLQFYPQFNIVLRVFFSTKPERLQELIDKSHFIVKRFSRGEMDREVLATARKTLATTYNNLKNDVGTYSVVMQRLKDFRVDPFQGHHAYLKALNNIKDNEVYAYLKANLRDARYYQVIQNPLK